MLGSFILDPDVELVFSRAGAFSDVFVMQILLGRASASHFVGVLGSFIFLLAWCFSCGAGAFSDVFVMWSWTRRWS